MRALLIILLLLLAVAGAGRIVTDYIPAQHWPFSPLDLEQPLGLATSPKLAQLARDPARCRAMLDRSALQTVAIPDRGEGFCSLHGAVAIKKSSIRYSGPVRVTCPMAAALYLWERDVVAPAAARHLGARVMGIDHLGTYSCRRIYGSASGRPSQHATANAIDVAAFRLSDGRRISVASGWRGDSASRAFLLEVRKGSCRLFRSVLTPDYNQAHRDHFHLDMGPYSLCR